MKQKAYNQMYHAYHGKSRWKRGLQLALAALLVLILLAAAGGWLLFRRELAIAGTLRPIAGGKTAYFMEVRGDYHFDEFLSRGGASSDGEVAAFLTEKISKGFYSVPAEGGPHGCSTLTAYGEGGLLWGRNYDWTGSVPILVRHVPEEGYVSLSTCDFQNVTGGADVLPEDMVHKLLAVAALYVPMDGVNEAGLCVADLEVNEGGMPDPDTDKPDLTVTTAIRLLLDRAGTVDEALALLEGYDIHPSGGISHHLSISDASGRSVAVEFTGDGFTAVGAPVVTNFNLANGDPAAGGESARQRYNSLMGFFLSGEAPALDRVRTAMARVTQTEGAWTTQWTMLYDRAAPQVTWYFGGDFSQGVTLPIFPESGGEGA